MKKQSNTATNNRKNLKKALVPFGIFLAVIIGLLVYHWYSEYRTEIQEKERLMTLVKELKEFRHKMNTTELVSITESLGIGSRCRYPVFFGNWKCSATTSMIAASEKSSYEIASTANKILSASGYFNEIRNDLRDETNDNPGVLYTTHRPFYGVSPTDHKTR